MAIEKSLTLSGDLPPGASDWLYLGVDVPVGVNRISLSYDYDRPDVPTAR